ncbi:MAG: alpha/beta hydrolase [Deltaproteobacteria bacterium]|nr:alpha/beta hydrolase [Deltaproteobacteria bacterium]MBW2659831.1 alpha/beta hydrolase [Deltaproteobacteria bacterium]
MQNYAKIDNSEVISALFPEPAENRPVCPGYAEDIEFGISDGSVLTCRFYPGRKNDPTLLYFPNSLAPVDKYDAIAESFTGQGINFLLTSYHSHGNNERRAGIVSMMNNLPFILQETVLFLKKEQFSGPLFTMGESIGSAFAIEITSSHPDQIKGMIIESGFCETIPFLTGSGVTMEGLELQESDGFNNKGKITDIELPTLILHGARDKVVPPPQAETLQASSGARNKQFFIIPGAEHTTIAETGGPLYFQTIKTFIDTVSGVNTWRQRRRNSRKRKE